MHHVHIFINLTAVRFFILTEKIRENANVPHRTKSFDGESERSEDPLGGEVTKDTKDCVQMLSLVHLDYV